MTQLAFLVPLSLLISGCVFHSEPKENREFSHVSKLREFDGVYKNKGDPRGFLSGAIWQTSKKLPPVVHDQDVEFIDVASTENTLTVKAIQNGCVVYEKSYAAGRDFEISNGKISIRRDVSVLNDVLIGPVYETIVMGLDAEKNGKLRSTTVGGGLVFLFLPVAVSDTRDVRFERIADIPQVYAVCDNRYE